MSGTNDCSAITAYEQIDEMVDKGELEAILLFPEEFGGEEIDQNIVYVPIGFVEIKQKITDTLIKFVEDGLISNMQVQPVYKGASLIPAQILITTSHEGKPAEFNPTINIW